GLRVGGDRGAHRHHRTPADLQCRPECPAGRHGAQQIDLDLSEQVVLCRRQQIPALHSAGAGYQGIDVPMGVLHLRRHLGQPIGIGDVDVVAGGRPALVRIWMSAREADDSVAVAGKVFAHRASDPARTPGDHHHRRVAPSGGRAGGSVRCGGLTARVRRHRASSAAGWSKRAKCRSKCSLFGAFVSRLTTTSTATPTTAAAIAGCQPASGIGSHPMCRLTNSTSETSIEETAPAVVARRQYKPATSDGKIRNTAGQVISTMIPMMLSGPKKATSRPPPTKNGNITRVVTVSVRSSALVEAPRPA